MPEGDARERGAQSDISVLWPGLAPTEPSSASPEFFTDLALDQVVGAATREFAEYNLAPFFAMPLVDVEAVEYRLDAMQDLDRPEISGIVSSFAERMREMRARMAAIGKSSYAREQDCQFLRAAEAYVNGVEDVETGLARVDPHSDALRRLRSFFSGYRNSEPFEALARDTRALTRRLADITYTVAVRGLRVVVRRYEAEADLTTAIERTFERFRAAEQVPSYRAQFPSLDGLNRIEADILDRVARLFPDVFADLGQFRADRAGYASPTVSRFDREVHFYVAWLSHVAPLKERGLPFCRPAVAKAPAALDIRGGFDIALAQRLLSSDRPVVLNDLSLTVRERLVVVTGPNHGGKTTFARMIGQIHYLASLGCYVPGTSASLQLCDRILSHFEHRERGGMLRGKLQDDLVRLRVLLSETTTASLIVLNELFASTTATDAVLLAQRILHRVATLGALCLCVTFLDELAAGPTTVSIVAGVDPRDPSGRTYKLTRRPPTGVAHALALAEQHRVTQDWLLERIHP